MAPAASTPSAEHTSSTRRPKKRTSGSVPWYFSPWSETRAVTTPPVSSPGSTHVSAKKLRPSSPAPTRSTTDSATSATTRPFRTRLPALRTAVLGVEGARGLHPGRVNRGQEAEQQARDHREADREQHHPAVDAGLGDPGQREGVGGHRPARTSPTTSSWSGTTFTDQPPSNSGDSSSSPAACVREMGRGVSAETSAGEGGG